jgi:solute carrier family 25 folate transporter 32
MVFVFNPLWLIKTRLSLQGALNSTVKYSGLSGTHFHHVVPKPLIFDTADAVRQIYRQEGIIGFYRGLVPALLLTSHGAIQVRNSF